MSDSLRPHDVRDLFSPLVEGVSIVRKLKVLLVQMVNLRLSGRRDMCAWAHPGLGVAVPGLKAVWPLEVDKLHVFVSSA